MWSEPPTRGCRVSSRCVSRAARVSRRSQALLLEAAIASSTAWLTARSDVATEGENPLGTQHAIQPHGLMPQRPRDSRTDATDSDQPILRSPTELPTFLIKLDAWLPEQESNYKQLLEFRTVMYRTTTCVVNATHARMLLTDKWPTDYGFRKPAPTTIPFDAGFTPILGTIAGLSPQTGRREGMARHWPHE